MKKHIFTGSILVLPGLFITSALFYLVIMSGAIFSFIPNPPNPDITYGEFPINIIYEVNGEIQIVKDIVVCEFNGFDNLGSGGKRRKWKAYLKSGNERLVLLRKETETLTFEISTAYGLPEYYMGDFNQRKEYYEDAMNNDKYLGYIQWNNGVQTGYLIKKEEAEEIYKLKILDIQYSQPIQNSFSSE